MHIKRIQIENVRCIKSLDWEVEDNQLAGWHVVLGDNGSGKSTFLRSVSHALVGPDLIDLGRLIRSDEQDAKVVLDLLLYQVYDQDLYDSDMDEYGYFSHRLRHRIGRDYSTSRGGVHAFSRHFPANIDGFFSAAYGPFRNLIANPSEEDGRNTGSIEKIRLAAHLSLFNKRFALTKSLTWLKQLRFKQLENKPEGELLDRVKEFINQSNFLPNNCYLDEVSSEGVQFRDANGVLLPVQELSDGYDSILSLTFDLIRQLTLIYQTNDIFDPEDPTKIIMPGVVLIDEIDAHLHPTWQRQIGQWFRSHFPQIQFIVTTHSPLICQAATVGSIYKLPQPGTDEQGRMLTGQERDRLLYGNVLDAYSTGAFGLTVNRSEEAQNRLQRLAELNQKELFESLTAQETEEQTQLRAMMPTSAHQTL